MIVDTNIIIDFLKGKEEAIDFVAHLESLITSVVVVSELYSGVASRKELEILNEFLDFTEQLEITPLIAKNAGLLRRKYMKSHGIEIPDALIAATANSLKIPVATLDKKHFSVISEEILIPY